MAAPLPSRELRARAFEKERTGIGNTSNGTTKTGPSEYNWNEDRKGNQMGVVEWFGDEVYLRCTQRSVIAASVITSLFLEVQMLREIVH